MYMKRLILSISILSVMFILSTCGNESKKNIEIPDANFKAYLLANFDANKDGEISLSEALEVSEIDCSNRNIEVLDGIEKFENLERLICKDNQLDELELRYNKKLNLLICTNNKDPLTIYFAMSSPLSNKNFVPLKNNDTPEATHLVYPFDVEKVVFDMGKTDFILCFD